MASKLETINQKKKKKKKDKYKKSQLLYSN